MKSKLLNVALSLIVFTYIVFEELIWESIAKPIYNYLHSLEILRKLEHKIHSLKPWMLLSLFLVIFIKVELLGILAGIALLKGNILTATALYIAKVPVAAFAFWLFRVGKDKLLGIKWFKKSYDFTMKKIDALKETSVYIGIKKKTSKIKRKLKELKRIYLPKGEFKKRVKKIYIRLKKIFKKTDI